jgi:transcriptional regulator GlxA family with amidase domain
MKIGFLVTRNRRLLSLVAALDLFEMANRFLKEQNSSHKLELVLLGIEETHPFQSDYQHIEYQSVDSFKGNLDLISVPAFATYQMQENIQANLNFIPFMVEQYTKGAALMSLCTGSFLIAASGLLNGKRATTHLDGIKGFSQAFPEVLLQPQAVITSDSQIFTSGGATSSFHLKLFVIQKYFGRELALRIAKAFSIDLDRDNQLYFDQFRPVLAESDELVRKIQLLINENYHEIKNLEEALEEIPSSKRNIIRRFKQSTGLTPIRYLQKTKIEAAKNLLETTNKDIVDVMVSTGYNDMKNFRNLFKTFTGLTPTGYRDKYGMRL